jgi:hypothetical protein
MLPKTGLSLIGTVRPLGVELSFFILLWEIELEIQQTNKSP